GKDGMAHCGLLRREDGRYYALLTLWPRGDLLSSPVCRARNRQEAGRVRNVRAEQEFQPSGRARASMMVPLEMGRGHQRVFFRRAVPRSAELLQKGGEYYLHV